MSDFADLSIFSFFEDPELNSTTTLDLPQTSSAEAWKDFFVSDMEDQLQGLVRQGSPDSGVDFELDTNALVTEHDPVFHQAMKSSDFQEEIDWMFNRPSAGVAAAPAHRLNLSFSISEDELDNIFSDNEDPTHSMSTHEDNPDTKPVITIKQEDTSATNPNKIHSYSAVPTTNSRPKSVRSSNGSRANRSLLSSGPRQRRSSSSTMNSRKRKLYEVAQPLANPEAEKCRLNAINAKKNRDRKKQQLDEAEMEIKRLRVENEELQGEAENARDELDYAMLELRELKEQMKKAGLSVGKSRRA